MSGVVVIEGKVLFDGHRAVVEEGRIRRGIAINNAENRQWWRRGGNGSNGHRREGSLGSSSHPKEREEC